MSMDHTPLPHEDQAHFHRGGLADIDGVLAAATSSAGLCPGEGDYFCGFDTLSTSGHAPSIAADDVIITGYEGGLIVYRMSSRQILEVGRLEGLQGSIVGAKVLPWTCRDDPNRDGRPYIALIIHSPVLDSRDGENAHSSDESRSASYDERDSAEGEPTRPSSPEPSPDMHDVIRRYRTTVEIYSLMTRSHIATLYTTPSVDVTYSANGEPRIPPPIGELVLDAKGKFLTIASGISGEIFVYSPVAAQKGPLRLENIRCVGKLWTSVKRRENVAQLDKYNVADQYASSEDLPPSRSIPIFSLSERWIATAPPPSHQLFTLNGRASLSQPQSRPPGVVDVTSPAPPPATCGVDRPDGAQLVNKISREVTQGVLKASKWIGVQSTSAWNAYWNAQEGARNPSQPADQFSAFPPTHSQVNIGTSNNHESRTAIYDLQRLLDAEGAQKESKNKLALTPLAVFTAGSGCSFVSFAPDGLSMITVGKKGDETIVWNLMKMHREWLHSNSGADQALGPYVRQMHKITRMTTSNVIDIAWSLDGSRFSILTDRGTIHIHEIPPSMLTWPLARRPLVVKEARKEEAIEDASNGKFKLSMAIDAANSAGAFIKQVRTRSASGGPTNGLAMTSAVSAKGSGQMISSGLKSGLRSLAFSADAIYHAADNKLHMQCLLEGAKPGLMRWLTGAHGNRLAVCQGPIIRIYNIRQTVTHRKGEPALYRAKISTKFRQLLLRDIPADRFAPAFIKAVEQHYSGRALANDEQPQTTGYWNLRAPNVSSVKPTSTATNWHSEIEAETNPPFQPFHTDRRSTLFAAPEPDTPPPSEPHAHASAEEMDRYHGELHEWSGITFDTWLEEVHHFGQEVWNHGEDAMQGANRLAISDAVHRRGALDDAEEMENEVRVVTGEGGEQVVVMTTMVKGASAGLDGVDDFFEDDCEVLDFAQDRV